MSDENNGGRGKGGFASMSPERLRELSSKGGKKAHENGRAHKFNSETSRAAREALQASGKGRKWTSEEAREASRRSQASRRAKKAAAAAEATS